MRDALSKRYQERHELLSRLCERLSEETHDILGEMDHIDRIYYRVKSTKSFVDKALDPQNDPPYQHPLIEIEDQIAGRIIVFYLSDIEAVRARMDGIFTAVERTHRRPKRDAEFGYESHHLICVIPPQLKPDGWNDRDDMPRTFELQIRTIFMHAYAEPQHDYGYKQAGDLPKDIRRELAWIAASAWGADHAYQRVATHLQGELPNGAENAQAP